VAQPRLDAESRAGRSPARGLACALFAVFVAVKAAVWSVAPPTSAAVALAAFAQDALVSVVFAAATRPAPPVLAVAGFAVLVVYAAVNAALVRALGTPLVAPMLRGVDGAMRDSAEPYLRFDRAWPIAAVAAVGAMAPAFTRRWSRHRRTALGALGTGVALCGVLLPSPPPALRNPCVAFVRSAVPRGWAEAVATADPRSPVPARLEPGLETLPGSARGRSVVVVVLESTAARFLGAYGAEPDAMPFVTDLARRSLLCTTAWTVYPESIKSQLALWHATAPAPDLPVAQHARVPVPGLAALLARAGYASGLFHAGRFRFLGMDQVLARSGFATLVDAASIGGDRESAFGVDEESTVTALLRFVDALPEQQPFLAAYLPVAGHHPYASPPGGPFPRDDVRGCYRAALCYADRAVRALWEGLCRRRPERDLVLCVVGDHGEAFGEHDGNFGHTFAVYEENLRVPLLFCVPGVTDAGLVTHRPASHLDVAPTLLHLLGEPPCAGHQGTSMLVPQARRLLAFTDWGDPLVALRDGHWKLILDAASGTARLFDLALDPAERTDCSHLHRGRVAAYREAALAWVGSLRSRVAAW